MKVTSFLLPAALCCVLCGVLYGQTAASPAAPGVTTSGTQAGAAGTRANGVPPTAPGLTGAGAATAAPLGGANGGPATQPAPATRANGRGRRSSARSGNAAPPANSRIVITGVTGSGAGTMDHPLLPIVSPGNALGIRSGTPIRVTLDAAIDSGHAHNGDMLDGKLAAPLGQLPAGTPVRLTVVQASPAGQISSYGELSIQVVSVSDRRILSDTITAEGKEGAKELPDAAPSRGTEAIFTPDQPLSLPAA